MLTPAAILFATVTGADGTCTATLQADGTPLLGRLLGQLESLGVRRAWVLTRPEWKGEVETIVAGFPLRTAVRASSTPSEDLRAVADIAEDTALATRPLVIAMADVLTHREALAGLLADPRVVTGILTTSSGTRGAWAARTRSVRGRVVSAGSIYHRVSKPNGHFLSVLKVSERDRRQLVSSAREFAGVVEEPRPECLDAEFARRREEWRRRMLVAAARAGHIDQHPGEHTAEHNEDADPHDLDVDHEHEHEHEQGHEVVPDPTHGLDGVVLSPEAEANLALRAQVSREDTADLVLVGLVRSRVHVTNSYLRALFWSRPRSQGAADHAAEAMRGYDEDRVLLDSAVKANDGFFTTHLVSPYSKYLARWAARRGLTPNAVTSISMVIGVFAAAAFATGSRAGLVAGAILLQVAFTADCVDGQLARYTRTFTKLGAWLDSVFDRGKEYVVFAGLALGSTRGFDDNVWMLAAVALALQTTRHVIDFSYTSTQHDRIAATPRLPFDVPEDTLAASRRAGDRDREPVASGQADQPAPTPAPTRAEEPRHLSRSLPRALLRRLGGFAIRLSRLLERHRWTRWTKKIVVLPIGERFALISVTAAFWEPRITFVVMLAWGSFAALYSLTGRVLRSVAA